MKLGARAVTGMGGLLAVVVAVGGCATTSRARSVEETGFLGPDYALLTPGGTGQAQMVYQRPGVDWASYQNVLLDPVTLWRNPDSKEKAMSSRDAQLLTDYFYGVIREALDKQGIPLVTVPEPHTLRAKVAITQAKESHVVLDVVSTVVPSAHAAASLTGLITGKPAFVGEGQVEAKATDAMTGELLEAGIDRRVGGKALTASEFSSWGDVERMMRLWADHGAYNLCMRMARSSCVAPSS
jgi:hypothetical protein